MADDDELQDQVVQAALRRIAARQATQAPLCPRCVRREVDDGGDWCPTCAVEVREERKARGRDWWAAQADYQGQREKVGATEAAARWLAQRLRNYDGAADSAQLRADAADAGIPERTLRRGRGRLQESGRLVIEKAGMPHGRTRWRLTRRHERDQMANSGTLDT